MWEIVLFFNFVFVDEPMNVDQTIFEQFLNWIQDCIEVMGQCLNGSL